MPFHICIDEIMAVMFALPLVGYAVTRVRAWCCRHRDRCCKGHHDG